MGGLDISLHLYASLLVTKYKNINMFFIADGMPHFMTIPLILPKMWITVIIIAYHSLSVSQQPT